MQAIKHCYLNRFYQDWLSYTSTALVFAGGLSLVLGLGVRSSPLIPLWTGIAGGLALSECATRFNRLNEIEKQGLQGGDSDAYRARLTNVQKAI